MIIYYFNYLGLPPNWPNTIKNKLANFILVLKPSIGIRVLFEGVSITYAAGKRHTTHLIIYQVT